MTDEYNGWSNRETWAVSLWLNNDYGLHQMKNEVVGKYSEDDRHRLADELKEFTESLFDGETFGPMNDELKNMRDDISSMWRVNWDEIAESELAE